MKTELKINGIYSYSFEDEENAYIIILKKGNRNTYYSYVLDCLNEYSNNEIQERLINDISNNLIKLSFFIEVDSTTICNTIDGYIGQCSDEICDKLLKFYETKRLKKLFKIFKRRNL